jgi:DNA topoisomerase VI subunit A
VILCIRVPIVALVDGDAYGLDIVSVYKFGSVTLRHEAHKLAAARIECIGIWASELASQVPRSCIDSYMRLLEEGSESTKTH